MNGSALQTFAADCAEELPGAQLEHPFGPDWEVFKVRGKVFMLLTEAPGRPVVILKADPGEALALREQYRHITPGYHMNKQHWITVEGEPEHAQALRRGYASISPGRYLDEAVNKMFTLIR
ncbi:MmcQ/YjbR family DNA-binding protein [Streptomyces xiamenensis]